MYLIKGDALLAPSIPLCLLNLWLLRYKQYKQEFFLMYDRASVDQTNGSAQFQFCNGAKLLCANLDSGTSYIG